MDRLRDLVNVGAIDRIYVHSPDRLARNYAYQVLLLDEWQRRGIAVERLIDSFTEGRIEQLDEALKALTGVRGVRGTAGKRGPAQASGKRRTMSAAARKRIAAAQRARWANWKAAQRGK